MAFLRCTFLVKFPGLCYPLVLNDVAFEFCILSQLYKFRWIKFLSRVLDAKNVRSYLFSVKVSRCWNGPFTTKIVWPNSHVLTGFIVSACWTHAYCPPEEMCVNTVCLRFSHEMVLPAKVVLSTCFGEDYLFLAKITFFWFLDKEISLKSVDICRFHESVHKRFQIFYPGHIFYPKFKKKKDWLNCLNSWLKPKQTVFTVSPRRCLCHSYSNN